MLMAVKQKGGTIKPTHMLYKANLSHEAMQKYLQELLGAGLLAEEDIKGKRVFRLTENGYRFVERYEKFKEFSDAFGI